MRSTELKSGDNWTVSFLPDARYVATGSSYGVVNLLSVASGQIESSLSTQENKFIYSVNFVILIHVVGTVQKNVWFAMSTHLGPVH